jgi:hypothetical protein
MNRAVGFLVVKFKDTDTSTFWDGFVDVRLYDSLACLILKAV